jgi:hypothetical protein
MPYTARLTLAFETLVADQFAVLGRRLTYLPATMKCLNADRRQSDIIPISGGLSAVSVLLQPLGGSAPGQLLFFLSDQAVDVRFTSAGAPVAIPAVRLMVLGATVSALFITTGLTDTTILLEAAGGSAVTVTTSLPLS